MDQGKKHLPIYLNVLNFKQLLSNNFSIIITYWFFQSIRYSNLRETIFKIFLTVILFVFFLIYFNPLISIIIAHSLNAILNGHFPAMLVHMGVGSPSPVSFIKYIEKLHLRLNKSKNIEFIYAYGSLSKGNYKPTSDIDIRIVPKNQNWIRCLLILWRERFFALISWFPLDIYAFSIPELSKKMRNDEPPINFGENNLNILYQNSVTFEDFKLLFYLKNIKTDD